MDELLETLREQVTHLDELVTNEEDGGTCKEQVDAIRATLDELEKGFNEQIENIPDGL